MKLRRSAALLVLLTLVAIVPSPRVVLTAMAADSTSLDKFKIDVGDLFSDGELARGKGVSVKRSQLDEAFVSFKANLATRNEGVPEGERIPREAQLLDRLIVTQMLTNRATEGDFSVAKVAAEKFTADAKKSAVSEDAFLGQLKAMGMSETGFRGRVLEQAICEAVIDRELRSKITINDSDVEALYKQGVDGVIRGMQADLATLTNAPNASPKKITELKQNIEELKQKNLATLDVPERVRVAHIFMSTRSRDTEQELTAEERKAKRDKIEKLRNRALNGDDFSKLVQEFSEDRNLKQTKGEYVVGRNDPFPEEFKATAFALGAGQISEVVSTSVGFHLIKVLDKTLARKIDLESVAKDLKSALSQQELQRRLPEFFGRLKKEADVEILDAKYRIALPQTIDPTKPIP